MTWSVEGRVVLTIRPTPSLLIRPNHIEPLGYIGSRDMLGVRGANPTQEKLSKGWRRTGSEQLAPGGPVLNKVIGEEP